MTLTLPDGRRTTYVFSINGDQAQWTASPDVQATASLTVLRPGIDDIINLYDPPFWASGDNTYGQSSFDNHDVPGWVLQTLDGTKYYITRGPVNNVVYSYDGISAGIEAQACGPPQLTLIVQRTGASTGIGATGITNYAGSNGLTTTIQTRSVLFDRDAQGRITALWDPNSQISNSPYPSVKYVYNQDSGNLIQVLKLVNSTAGTYTTNKYHYDNLQFTHYITKIENVNGVPVARNFYDASGRLTEVDDANGNKTQFLHSTTNQTEIVIDRLSNTNSYVYDLNGNVIETTNALGQIKLMAYDNNNNKTNEVTFLNGQPYATNVSFYDPNNLLLYSVNPLGYSNIYAYNQFGQVLTSIQPCGCGGATNYYDTNGNLTNSVDALGNSTLSFYDPATSLLVESVDPVGTVTTNTYDGYENLIATATLDASGTILSSNTFTYDANNNRTNSTVWRQTNGVWTAAITTYIYDAQNRVVQTINPGGGTNTVTYDPTGRQQATIDPLGRTNSYTYDVQGRLIQTTFPDGSYSSSAYDANGNRTNSVDRLGRATTYLYDGLNRLTNTIYADNTSARTAYDDVGRVQFTVDARGTTNAFGYDVASRRTAATNAWGTPAINISFYAFDANGNQTSFTDALSHTTTNVFDRLNRAVQVQYADGTMTSTAYDAAGRRVAETNQDGIVTLFGFDGAGRLTSVTNALGTASQTVTRYAYDQAGNLTNQLDALGRQTLFAFDSMGRRISRTLPGGQAETMGYDLAGNLITGTNFNGIIITNKYDALNRLTNRSSVNGYQIAYAYDAAGNRTSVTDTTGTTSYSYDSRNRLSAKTNAWTAGLSVALIYGYNANGDVTNIYSSTPGGVNLQYAYDPLNRITNVLAGGSAAASYGFDPDGNLQSVRLGNGVTNIYQYDLLNRLTNSIWKSNALTLASFYYQLGLTGNRTNLTETLLTSVTNRTYAWSYDPLYRLTNETISALGAAAYGLDKVGNRTNRTAGLLPAQTFSYASNDWLVTDAYDSNGNTLWTTNGGVATGPYNYDVENRLTNFSNSVYLGYNGDGIRVSKIANSTNFFYLVDDRNPSGYAQVLEEWTATGGVTNLVHVYNYGLALISQQQGGTVYYFIPDGHGSTRLMADNGGNVVNAFTYDAYGNLIASNAAPQTAFLYGGEQFDFHLGFYYFRARYDNSSTGRFLTMDSVEEGDEDPQSLHKYLYCEGNPVNNTDPSGNEVEGMLAAIDITSMFAAIISPVTSKVLSKAAPIQFKFKVVRGHPNADYFMPHGGAGHWGQPSGCAEGDYSIGTYTASSWVKVWSRDNAGGSCNTVNQPDPSGTIILYMKCALPGTVSVFANVRMDLTGTGPRGAATGKVEADSGRKILMDETYVRGHGLVIHEDNPYVFDATVGQDWTPVLKFIPTISFSKDNGKPSTGRAAGAIILHSFHK